MRHFLNHLVTGQREDLVGGMQLQGQAGSVATPNKMCHMTDASDFTAI